MHSLRKAGALGRARCPEGKDKRRLPCRAAPWRIRISATSDPSVRSPLTRGTVLVTDQDLVERLASHRTLGSAPRDQLAWLASRGTLRRFDAGETLARKGDPIHALFVVLTGQMSILVDRGAGPRKVMAWNAGDVGGLLPYSRLFAAPGNSIAEQATEVLALHRDQFPEMIAHCHELTSILVHLMLDRARRFTTSELHDEKMLSLGRLSAGLAHELNNPASALARSARELGSRLFEIEATALALGVVQLSPEQIAAISRVRAESDDTGARAALSPLARADQAETVADWLASHRLLGDVAEVLADTSITVESLDALRATLGDDAFRLALRSIGAGHRVRQLASEVEIAAGRIHSLVAAIKGFTYMDQTRVPAPVAIGKGLADTLAVLGAKARSKSVSVTAHVADDLPAVEGFGGELNQVWANLIDNAIDAAPPEGRVEVSATREGDAVVVRVVDDGPGVPERIKEQIFEPFFTTKPQGQGTGLGLDIARRLVRQHNGRLEVDSRPGRTEFRVILPPA